MEGKKNILYIEDDEFTRLMVQAQLEREGFAVKSFSGYPQHPYQQDSDDFDLVITDLYLDGEEGNGGLIRNIKSTYHVPVVVLTSATKEVKGADMVLSKPLDAKKIERIKHLVHVNAMNLDLSKVYQFACGDEELLANFLSTFTDNYMRDLSLLKEEIDRADKKAVEQRTHKMLSSVAYYGDRTLNHLLEQIEINAEIYTVEELLEQYYEVELHSRHLINEVQKKVTA